MGKYDEVCHAEIPDHGDADGEEFGEIEVEFEFIGKQIDEAGGDQKADGHGDRKLECLSGYIRIVVTE